MINARRNPALAGGVYENTAGDAVPTVDSSDSAPVYETSAADRDEIGFGFADDTPDLEWTASGGVVASMPPVAADAELRFRSAATICTEVLSMFLDSEGVAALRERDPSDVHDDLLALINVAISAQNELVQPRKATEKDVEEAKKANPYSKLGKGDTIPAQLDGKVLRLLDDLPPVAVAPLLAALYDIVLLVPGDGRVSKRLAYLAVYDDDPSSASYGLYISSPDDLDALVLRHSPGLDERGSKDVQRRLKKLVPCRARGGDPDLVAVANGIVDLSNRDADGVPAFMPFTPEHIFLAKLAVKWNPEAVNPVIDTPDGDRWDIESWMADFFPEDAEHPENAGMTELLWQIIGATVRPYVSWNKAAFFHSSVGNNGKGTLVRLMRNIVGTGNYASIAIADFGKEFYLEPLMHSSAILVDENDVGTFVDRGANFKAVITNDVITINRKGIVPIAHQHWGFMVQCLNDEPTTKDKSESFYRRQLFVKFTKSFTGIERRYIKDDYLKRPEVLEYALKRVLLMDYDELSEPQAVKDGLAEFKISNDPVRAFWEEFKDRFAWDLVPLDYAYDLFKSWFVDQYPNGKLIGANVFKNALVLIVQADADGEWECDDKRRQHRPGTMMDATEPLTVEYKLAKWINYRAHESNPVSRATMAPEMLKNTYRGLRRKGVADATVADRYEATVPGGVPPKPESFGMPSRPEDFMSTPSPDDLRAWHEPDWARPKGGDRDE